VRIARRNRANIEVKGLVRVRMRRVSLLLSMILGWLRQRWKSGRGRRNSIIAVNRGL
jgi:hypothetical protein